MAPRARVTARQEALAAEADQIAQERGPADARVPKVSDEYLHRVHPETGLDVVFVPGESLPDWVVLDDEA